MEIQLSEQPKKRLKLFCLLSPSPTCWTILIGIVDLIHRLTFITMDTLSILSILKDGHHFKALTPLQLFISPDPSGRFSLDHNVIAISIMRNSLGLLMAIFLFIGVVKKMSKFLQLWCLFIIVDTLASWICSVGQIMLTFFFFKGIHMTIALLSVFIVLTLVHEIDTRGQVSFRSCNRQGSSNSIKNLSSIQKSPPPPYKNFEPPTYAQAVPLMQV